MLHRRRPQDRLLPLSGGRTWEGATFPSSERGGPATAVQPIFLAFCVLRHNNAGGVSRQQPRALNTMIRCNLTVASMRARVPRTRKWVTCIATISCFINTANINRKENHANSRYEPMTQKENHAESHDWNSFHYRY